MKRNLIIIFLFLIFFNSKASSHALHYKDLVSLEYDILHNNKIIGFHKFNFNKKSDFLHVISEGEFKVTKIGLEIMNYQTRTEEKYKNNQLVSYNSKTLQNDKTKYVNLKLNNTTLVYEINGSSFTGNVENKESIIGSWWNHEIIKKNKQISAISGRILPQKVIFLGKKKININGSEYMALHFHFISDNDKPLDKKKLNIHVWYDEKTLLWLKSSYDKIGNWEYRLKKVQY